MDRERFQLACKAAAEREKGIISDADGSLRPGGIGTRGEKGVHSALKHYYEPDVTCHEIPVGGYIADIVGEHGVIEIQTASFYRLKEKLTAFLEAAPVTVVWPCVVKKRLITIDPDTGEVSSVRRSPKKSSRYKLLGELWGLGELLGHPRLSIIAALIEADEYRPAGQQKNRRRRGANNGIERIPTDLVEELRFDCPEDFRALIPDSLPGRFTMAELSGATGLSSLQTSGAVKALIRMGLIAEDGKNGRRRAFVRTADSALSQVGE